MKTRITTLLLILSAFAGTVQAQDCNEWNWPEDKAEAERKYVRQSDLVKNKQYAQAIAPNLWLLENTPKLHKGIYQNAAKIYRSLADATKDSVKQKIYADSLMTVYDMRMENCGDEKSVMNRKAIYAFKFNFQNRDTVDWVLEVFEKNMEVNGIRTLNPNLKYYMKLVQMNKVYQDNLTDDEILEKYDYVQNLLDEKIAKVKDEEDKVELAEIKSENDDVLAQVVNFDCDKVREILGPKLEANPDDVATAEKIFMFMRLNECTDDPLWLESVKTIHKNKPSFVTSKVIGARCMSAEDFECAEGYFNEGVELAETDVEKAEMYKYLGNIDRIKNSYSAARSHYREAISLGDEEIKKDSYNAIGSMYMNSWDNCKKGVSKVEDRAIFIAAYNMYRMAGNTSGMKNAKEQFPTVGDIFELNISKGDKVTVGCWINETVTVDTRD